MSAYCTVVYDGRGQPEGIAGAIRMRGVVFESGRPAEVSPEVAGALLPLSKLKKGNSKDLTKDLPKDKVIYCHCRAGTRSLQAADILQKLGYDVRPLKEGYEDLLKAGFTKSDK